MPIFSYSCTKHNFLENWSSLTFLYYCSPKLLTWPWAWIRIQIQCILDPQQWSKIVNRLLLCSIICNTKKVKYYDNTIISPIQPFLFVFKFYFRYVLINTLEPLSRASLTEKKDNWVLLFTMPPRMSPVPILIPWFLSNRRHVAPGRWSEYSTCAPVAINVANQRAANMLSLWTRARAALLPVSRTVSLYRRASQICIWNSGIFIIIDCTPPAACLQHQSLFILLTLVS